MGKKNKKHKDYFDMSPEEQMANAEMFNEVEKGEASFLDALNYKVPTGPIAQSDYTRQIEKACLGKIEVDEDESYISEIDNAINNSDNNDNDVDNDTEGYMPYSKVFTRDTHIHKEVIVESNDDDDDADDQTDSEDDENDYEIEKLRVSSVYGESVTNDTDEDDDDDAGNEPDAPQSDYDINYTENNNKFDDTEDRIQKVMFNYDSVVGRMFIDDGLIRTPISVWASSSIELNEEKIPSDEAEFSTLMSKIFFYIISCKHPAVIISEDTFNIEFTIYSKINTNKFVFFKNNGFIYAYLLDEEETDKFYSVIDQYNMDKIDTMRYMICTSHVVSNIHNIFMHDDEDEVDSVMDERHNIKEFLKVIDNDSDTQYAGHNASGDVTTRMGVVDLQTYISDVRQIIDDIEDEIMDDESDDDVDDENENSDDNIDINDFPELDSTSVTINETETLEIEKVTTIDTDTDDMIIPVIHRRQ